jgi:hypothetical protein
MDLHATSVYSSQWLRFFALPPCFSRQRNQWTQHLIIFRFTVDHDVQLEVLDFGGMDDRSSCLRPGHISAGFVLAVRLSRGLRGGAIHDRSVSGDMGCRVFFCRGHHALQDVAVLGAVNQCSSLRFARFAAFGY